jgi:hypothetical protein
MDSTILLSNLGSLFLGMTLAVTVIFRLAARQGATEPVEGCVATALCLCGGSVAVFCYMAAVQR